jgi:hypothetical protein
MASSRRFRFTSIHRRVKVGSWWMSIIPYSSSLCRILPLCSLIHRTVHTHIVIYCFRVVISYSTLLLRIVISLCVNAPLCRRRAFSQMKLVTVRDFSSVSKVTPGHPKTISSSLVHTSPHRQNDSFLFYFFLIKMMYFLFFLPCL